MLKRSILVNKIEETDECCRKNETTEVLDEKSKLTIKKDTQKETRKTVNVIGNGRIRPSSAGGANDVKPWKNIPKKRPSSFCTSEKQMSQDSSCPDGYGRKLQELNAQLQQRGMNTVIPPSFLCTHQNNFSFQQKNSQAHLNRRTVEQQKMRRCRSTSNISGSGVKVYSQVFYNSNSLSKFKRSLKLLGFNPTDLDTHCKETSELRWKKTPSLPTLSTKLIRRTVSLDSLKETLREVWPDDCLDFYQRKILSQAAYEEWYFRKEREWQIKQREKKMEAVRKREKMCQDYIMKKVRAEEEFKKWALRKRRKTKENDENSIKTIERGRKTKEEIENAFLRWKKDKDKELREKGKNKKREEENNRESERQKMERKIVAEKAFQQWKNKLYKWKKCEKEKIQKKQERFEKGQKRKRDSQISFQTWKAIKDEAIRQNSKEIRNAAKVKRKERLARMEERLYEAEQAFEEWLEKKSFRKQTKIKTRQKNIPWIPV